MVPLGPWELGDGAIQSCASNMQASGLAGSYPGVASVCSDDYDSLFTHNHNAPPGLELLNTTVNARVSKDRRERLNKQPVGKIAHPVQNPKNDSGAARSTDVRETSLLTTVVVKNIPRHYTMQILFDEFIKLKFASSIDYLNLLEDKKGGKNRGYAFVNLSLPEIAVEFKQAIEGHTWQQVNPNDPIQKQASASWALVQGFEANNAKHPMSMFVSADPIPAFASASSAVLAPADTTPPPSAAPAPARAPARLPRTPPTKDTVLVAPITVASCATCPFCRGRPLDKEAAERLRSILTYC